MKETQVQWVRMWAEREGSPYISMISLYRLLSNRWGTGV